MKNNNWSVAASIVATAILATAAHSQVVEGTRKGLTNANTLYGPTGLIKVPTAYVTQQGTVALSSTFGRNIRVPAANYGLFPYIEVGGAFVDRESADNKAIASAKVSIIPSNFSWFEVGVGVIDPADAIGQTFYFIASADLIPPKWEVPDEKLYSIGLKAHLGTGTGLFNERIIGGGEMLFTKKLSLLGEYDSKDFNAAVRYSPTDYLRFQVGFQGKDLHFSLTTTFKS